MTALQKVKAILTEMSAEEKAILSGMMLGNLNEYFPGTASNPGFYYTIHSKSVVHDCLAKAYSDILFEECPQEFDFVSDIDYLGHVGEKAFGIQIKPVTAKSNFGNYSASERMKASFRDFEAQFGGKVFIIFSLDGEIANKEVLKAIDEEIDRLRG
ncbi:MAG: hypothetical protein SH848_01975 [Saprospiraceae bacterium]|nr:hypothetical protein [Saprospiraceae bacterium]MDZ4702665.1 hypothetical protein [Saprospiraceae bacterium]